MDGYLCIVASPTQKVSVSGIRAGIILNTAATACSLALNTACMLRATKQSEMNIANSVAGRTQHARRRRRQHLLCSCSVASNSAPQVISPSPLHQRPASGIRHHSYTRWRVLEGITHCTTGHAGSQASSQCYIATFVTFIFKFFITIFNQIFKKQL